MRPCQAVLLAGCVGLAGCSTFGDLVGLATGAAAGGATANPAVGYAVAVGTAAAADAALDYVARVRARAEQDAIAAVAGPLAAGGSAPWAIRHDIPFGNEHGEVRVVREIATPLATCREIAFSVVDEPAPPAFYVTSVCAKPEEPRWKWAQAEPTVERWGYLQ